MAGCREQGEHRPVPRIRPAEPVADHEADEHECIERRVALGHLLDSQIVAPEDQPRFAAALRDAMRWRDSTLIEIALVAAAIGLILEGVRSDLPVGLSNWRTATAGTDARLTAAGWWYAVVSLHERIAGHLRFLFRVQVVEVAEELVEAMGGRQVPSRQRWWNREPFPDAL